MARSTKETDSISPTFFLQVMNHWATPCTVGAVVGLGLFLLCSGPWGIALGVATSFSGAMFSALRFFSSSVPPEYRAKHIPVLQRKAKIFSPRILSPFEPVLDADPLEQFLFLLYGVNSARLKSTRMDVAFNRRSPLISSIQKISFSGSWGTELHVHYLSRFFRVPYRVVRVSGDLKVYAFGYVSDLNPGKTDRLQLRNAYCIQLINHGGVHWTTMFGKEPVVGEVENRKYINNPAGGDCLFYAFALGLAKYICHEARTSQELEQSAIFKAWCASDSVMSEPRRAEALFKLGTVKDPRKNVISHDDWNIFQQSLRRLVARYMCDQLKYEGISALRTYKNIHKNKKNDIETNMLIINLFEKNPLYREFNMLYNLDKKAVFEDLATNIFKDLHQTHRSMAYTNKINI
ncbi:MAG: hypothetical protein P1U36_02830 [Legionellaceae bacterium]|nr:hypothetical protein [Legionellaceae bacterium]